MDMQYERSQLSPNLALSLYYGFKLLTVAASAFAIYLGYYLFVLGVTGQASLVVESRSWDAQLVNAAPGLFFAVGGLAALIASILKGVRVSARPSGRPRW